VTDKRANGRAGQPPQTVRTKSWVGDDVERPQRSALAFHDPSSGLRITALPMMMAGGA
jgi:hypothetical protein